jgi:hypothetical protein
MERLQILKTDSGLHLEGFPDAVKVIRVDCPRAKRLADLALHKSDLEFAAMCLEAINQASEEPPVLRQALWRAAIVHFMKCFGDSARFQLSEKKIYKGNPTALTVFAYFKDLRNKHFVHDENSYAQSVPGAVLNNGRKSFKIEKIVCFNVFGDTLDQEGYDNLGLLVRDARAWVAAEVDALCESITADLEAKTHEDLLSRDAVTISGPKIEEIGKRRTAP